ncbi:MAG: GIY-YIG nuclease family protein [Anaerolineales bacterium]
MHYSVYIISSPTGVLYTGVTNDLARRIHEHKSRSVPGFSKRYRISRLVYFEETSSIRSAIEREKQIKGLRRAKKLALVRNQNPEFKDLSEDWFE